MLRTIVASLLAGMLTGLSDTALAQRDNGQIVDGQAFYAMLESEEETLSIELKKIIEMREQGRCSQRKAAIESALKSIASLSQNRTAPGRLSAYDAEQLKQRFLAEQALPCVSADPDPEPAVSTIRDEIEGGAGPDAQTAIAELEAISKICAENPTNAPAQNTRYDRFYRQVESEIAGYGGLLQTTTDPAIRRHYADRMILLGTRLAQLPKPDQLGCEGDAGTAGPSLTVADSVYSDPLWGTWQVMVERIRGTPTEGRVAVWPNVDLRCESRSGESCIYRWRIAPGGDYGVEGSATHMMNGHNGIFDVVHGGGTASVTHSYFPNTEVPEQLILSPDSMTGVWYYNGELAGRSSWRRQPSLVTQIGLSNVTGDFAPSEDRRYAVGTAMTVTGSYDAFDWSAQNSARIRRPKILVNLYGDNMDGAHFVEFPQDTGFEPEMSRPIYPDDGKRRVIGASVLVTLMPDATPGRKRMTVDGQDYFLDVAISGYPAKAAD